MNYQRLISRLLIIAVTLSFQFSSTAQLQIIYPAQKVITMDSVNSVYTAVAVDKLTGKIAGLGTPEQLKAQFKLTGIIDNRFSNNIIMPGFVEAHTHLQAYGMYAKVPYIGYFDRPGVDTVLKGITTRDSIITYLKNTFAQNKGLPLFATSADPIYFSGGRFTHHFLDSVSKTVPIVIQSGSGHVVICDSAMLAILEKKPGWLQLPPNSIIRDSNGNPTGELDEAQAVEFVFSEFDTVYKKASGHYFFTPERMSNGIIDAGKILSKAGITTATDLFFSAPNWGLLTDNYLLYKALLTPIYPVRVVLAYDGLGLTQMFNNNTQLLIDSLKKRQSNDNNMLRTGPVKFIVDGSIQGYTAEIAQPGYISSPVNPFWNLPPAQLGSLMSLYLSAGFPVAIHSNGDSAIGLVVNALDSIQRSKASVPSGIWATIEHAQMINSNQFNTIRSLSNVALNIFVNHIYYYAQQHALYTIGFPRVDSIDNTKKAQDMGITYAMHSDAPVTPALPLFAAYTATKRMPAYFNGLPYNNHQFGDTITTQQALYAITMGPAKLLNMQNEVGSIEPGKWADFAILGADPFNLPLNTLLKDVPIVNTMKGGVVFPLDKLASKHKKTNKQ